jgi:hypothetical protein
MRCVSIPYSVPTFSDKLRKPQPLPLSIGGSSGCCNTLTFFRALLLCKTRSEISGKLRKLGELCAKVLATMTVTSPQGDPCDHGMLLLEELKVKLPKNAFPRNPKKTQTQKTLMIVRVDLAISVDQLLCTSEVFRCACMLQNTSPRVNMDVLALFICITRADTLCPRVKSNLLKSYQRKNRSLLIFTQPCHVQG